MFFIMRNLCISFVKVEKVLVCFILIFLRRLKVFLIIFNLKYNFKSVVFIFFVVLELLLSFLVFLRYCRKVM